MGKKAEEAKATEAEAKKKAAEEAQLKADAKKKAAEEAQVKAEEEARLKAEAEAKKKAEEEARLKAEAEAKKKAAEEARLKAEAEAKAKAAEEARLKAEEEEARIRAEHDAKRLAEEEARIFNTDIVQDLFVEKIREYAQKKQAAGGNFVDATPQTEANLQAELDKVAKKYGGGEGVDMTKFPEMVWTEPLVEAIDIPKIEPSSDRVVVKEKKSLKLLANWYDMNQFGAGDEK